MNWELNKINKVEFIVKENNSAKNMKSGDLEVLSTPSLVAFMEQACRDFLNNYIEDGKTSVGTNININHLAPTSINKKIIIDFYLKEVKKEKIFVFNIEAFENDLKIADAEHTRVVVETEKFLNNLNFR